MPKPPKRQDIHVRLSKRGSETFQDLEEISGFSGSRLVEEIVLAIDDVMVNFAALEVALDKNTTKAENIAMFSMFMSAMSTILDRIGYSEIYEDFEKEHKKEERLLTRAAKKKSRVKEK